MPSFEIYELRKIDGGPTYPTGPEIQKGPENVVSSCEQGDAKKIYDNIYGRTVQLHFLRMSYNHKMDLITNMFLETKSLRSLAFILNIFFSVNTKLISYSKITVDSNSTYEQFILDHDRMLDDEVLSDTLKEDIEWYKTLDDSQQINLVTGLMRLAAGNIIKKMYWRLIKIFNEKKLNEQRVSEKYTSRTSMDFPEDIDEKLISVKEYQPISPDLDEDTDYDTECPTHKKVVEARKQWQATMVKLRKEVETEVQKLNEPILQRIKLKMRSATSVRGDSGKKGKDRDSLSGKSQGLRTQSEEIDWVQLLPVWTVKKIFSYIDEKSLQNLKNVNNYWAAISKEVLAEKKARDQLDSTIKKSEEFLDVLLDIPVIKTDLEVDETVEITETTGYRKRMEKQRRTGASLRRIQQDPKTLHNKSILTECFNLFETQHEPFLTHLKPFPIGTPIKTEQETDKSINISIAETSMSHVRSKIVSEVKSPVGSAQDIDNQSSTASIMSLVPSIVVSQESMETW